MVSWTLADLCTASEAEVGKDNDLGVPFMSSWSLQSMLVPVVQTLRDRGLQELSEIDLILPSGPK